MTAQANPTPLAAAAARRSLDTQQRVRRAIRDLERDSEPVNFVTVAKRAKVSRAFLYEHAELRSQIETLRTANHVIPPRLVAGRGASDDSLRVRLQAALNDNQHLRKELAMLRDELAIAHGRVREIELDQRARRLSHSS